MKIISTILYTIFVALIVGIAGLLLGSMLPIPGNIEMKIVKSGSMEPSIPTGSIVILKPQQLYAKGDIVTFGKDTQTDIPTTHRIIAISDDRTYIVKGDANEEADPNPVEEREIIGKVVFHVPYAGFVLDFARQPIGFALLIAIPAGLVILEELLTIFNETRKWWRRRNDKDGEGGNADSADLQAHFKTIYAKRRRMDEIMVLMYVEPHVFEFAWWKRRLRLHKDAYGTATMLTLGLVFASSIFSGASGGTLSYFQDIEKSVGNLFGASDDFAPRFTDILTDTDDTLTQLSLPSLDTQLDEGLPAAPETEDAGEILGVSDEAPSNDGAPPESPSGDSGTSLPVESLTDAPSTGDAVTDLPANGSPEESPPTDPRADSPPVEPPPLETPLVDPPVQDAVSPQ